MFIDSIKVLYLFYGAKLERLYGWLQRDGPLTCLFKINMLLAWLKGELKRLRVPLASYTFKRVRVPSWVIRKSTVWKMVHLQFKRMVWFNHQPLTFFLIANAFILEVNFPFIENINPLLRSLNIGRLCLLEIALQTMVFQEGIPPTYNPTFRCPYRRSYWIYREDRGVEEKHRSDLGIWFVRVEGTFCIRIRRSKGHLRLSYVDFDLWLRDIHDIG